jgi:hypothetical protein
MMGGSENPPEQYNKNLTDKIQLTARQGDSFGVYYMLPFYFAVREYAFQAAFTAY